jgi:CRP-like cAMP-binding protein
MRETAHLAQQFEFGVTAVDAGQVSAAKRPAQLPIVSMSDPVATPRPAENQILRGLPAAEQDRLRPLLTPVELEQGAVIYQPGQPVPYVLFVDEGMISVVSTMEDGATIEIATIGNEGMAGLGVLLGVESTHYRHTVQVAGRGRKMSVATLGAEMAHDRHLRKWLYRYHAAFMTHIMQGVACNGLHSVEQRCCRWLLTTQDRLGANEFNITHDFLSQMLGVRRASVTEVLRPLQDRGLISTRRGRVAILDSKRLAASSCECYRVVRDEYQRLLS